MYIYISFSTILFANIMFVNYAWGGGFSGVFYKHLCTPGVPTGHSLLQYPGEAFMAALCSLMSEDKAGRAMAWFHGLCNEVFISDERGTDGSNSDSFRRAVVRLPSFFEFINECFDDLKRDVSAII
jgi:hypothetical protein